MDKDEKYHIKVEENKKAAEERTAKKRAKRYIYCLFLPYVACAIVGFGRRVCWFDYMLFRSRAGKTMCV